MNYERIQKIIDWLDEDAPNQGGVAGFNMSTFGDCGTVACIAGTAIEWFSPWGRNRMYDQTGGGSISDHAAKLLGLDADRAEELFIPAGSAIQASPDWAARTLRYLLATGEVDWYACEKALPA